MTHLLFVTEDHSKANLGITTSLNFIADSLACHASRPEITILSTAEKSLPPKQKHQIIEVPPSRLGRPWRWSPRLESVLSLLMTAHAPRWVHLHGVWMAPQWQAAKRAITLNLPVMISAHGMLEPWLWQEQGQLNRIKKQFYWNRIAYPTFKAAQVIHAITPLERERLSQLFPGSRIEVIPNGIDTSEIDNALDKHNAVPEKIILFIGRLHPKKGTHLILEAFGQAQLDSDWQLVIAGPCEDASYHRKLQDIAMRLNLKERIRFIGPVYAPEKFHLYQRAWLTVVPSFSEVVGLVNLESASCNTPTLTTHATGLYNWEEGGGLLVDPTIPEIVKALEVASRWSQQERQERGKLARSLVDRSYSTRHVGKLWTQLYEEYI